MELHIHTKTKKQFDQQFPVYLRQVSMCKPVISLPKVTVVETKPMYVLDHMRKK
jgi:hypothetical protein